MNRAYSFLQITKADSDQRVIEGIATSATPDRVGDVVEPAGSRMKLPLPLLLDHDHSLAVGTVEQATPTAQGIRFRARIAKIDEPGEAKNLVDKAWALVRHGLRACVSIGFRPIDLEPLGNGGVRFTSWEWLELSLVAVPANADCTIQTIKAYDQRARKAARLPVRVVRLTDPVRRAGTLPVVRLDMPVSRSIVNEMESDPRAADPLMRAITTAAKTADECFEQLHQRIAALETR